MSLRVMVIDDSEPDLLFTQIMLERALAGCEVLPFESAREALQALALGRAAAVDVILLDINMPGMNGFEFLDAYRQLQHDRKARAVVVMLTSSPDPKDRMRALGYDCVKGYAIKPIDADTAAALVRYVDA